MSPEAQRIAIAEACGWTKHRRPDACKCGEDIPIGKAMFWEYAFVPPQFNGNMSFWRPVPMYTTDLNAMHEAEKAFLGLNVEHHRRYEDALTNISGGLPWLATAAQRAEAFLRTLGKWSAALSTKEEQK